MGNILNMTTRNSFRALLKKEMRHVTREVYVLTPSGKKICMEVYSFSKIRDIKRMIAAKTGINPSEQHLTFNGQELKDNREFLDYSVENGSTLHLQFKTDSKWFTCLKC